MFACAQNGVVGPLRPLETFFIMFRQVLKIPGTLSERVVAPWLAQRRWGLLAVAWVGNNTNKVGAKTRLGFFVVLVCAQQGVVGPLGPLETFWTLFGEVLKIPETLSGCVVVLWPA